MNTPRSWDETQVHAFVDGELDAALAAQLETDCRSDAALAARVTRQRRLHSLLRERFDPVLDEPVPARLREALAGAPHPDNVVALPVPPGARARPHPAWWGALAASLVIGVMIGWWVPGRPTLPLSAQAGGPLATGELAHALSQQLSTDGRSRSGIAVVLSFHADDGRYCRTFSLATGTDGLACRSRRGWELEVLARAPARPASDSDAFRQAATELSTAVLTAVGERQSGDVLTVAEERRLRDMQWQAAASPPP